MIFQGCFMFLSKNFQSECTRLLPPLLVRTADGARDQSYQLSLEVVRTRRAWLEVGSPGSCSSGLAGNLAH